MEDLVRREPGQATVGSVDVVELLPHGELLGQVDVVGVLEELVELELVGEVRALDLPVQVGARRLDVDVSDALVLDVPVELRLELVSVISPDGVDAEREAIDDVVDEVDRVRLGVLVVDAQRTDPRGVVDRRVLRSAGPCGPLGSRDAGTSRRPGRGGLRTCFW